MKNSLISISTPFVRTSDSVTKIMADVLIALLPCCVMAWVAFGWSPVFVILVCCSSAVVTEFLFALLFSRSNETIADGSAIITGTLLACTIAPFTPLHVAAFGGVMAVLFGKLLSGGLGRNRFNPALVGREFMTVFFPAVMTSGTIWYDYEKVNFQELNVLSDTFLNALFFEGGGAIGEYSVFFLVIGGIYLLLRNRINWHIPTALTISFTLLFMLLPKGEYGFSLGGVLLGAIYMATDMPTSASTRTGQIYFGAMIGASAVMFIAFDVRYAYLSYSILLLNAFVTPINWIFRPRVWGSKNQLPQQVAQGAGLAIAILGTAWCVIKLHEQGWIVYLVYLYIAWSVGNFLYLRYKPDASLT